MSNPGGDASGYYGGGGSGQEYSGYNQQYPPESSNTGGGVPKSSFTINSTTLMRMARVRAQATTFNRSSKRFTSKTFRNYGGGYDGGAGQQRKNLYEEEVEIDTGAYVP